MSESLLSGAADAPATSIDAGGDTAAPVESSEANNVEATPEASWYYAEGVPGTGEKPEYFNDKTFKSLADQAKAQGELRKKLGAFTGAPEEYDLNVPEGFDSESISDEDPLLVNFAEMAKEANMNQETFDKVVGLFLSNNQEGDARQQEINEAYQKEQLEEIGPDYQEKINHMDQFLKNNFSESSADQFKNVITDAATMKAFMELADKMGNRKILNAQSAPQSSYTREDHILAMADPRFGTDRAYRMATLAKGKTVYGG